MASPGLAAAASGSLLPEGRGTATQQISSSDSDDEHAAKRARRGEGGASLTPVDGTEDVKEMQDLDDWMLSWQQGSMNADGERVLRPAATDEEKLRYKQEQEARKVAKEAKRKRTLEKVHDQLLPLVDAAEAQRSLARSRAARLRELGAADDPLSTGEEAARILQELESGCALVGAADKACRHYQQHLLENEPEERLQAEANFFLDRVEAAAKALQDALGLAHVQKRVADSRRAEVERHREATRAAEEQDRLFRRYDRDKDGLLCAGEVLAFVRAECPGDLSQESVLQIVESMSLANGSGVGLAEFPQLRLRVGVAAVAGALGGVDAEIAKAEAKAKPLSAKGPAAVPIAALGDAVEELETALDAGRDYLQAAREQVAGMALQQEEQGGPETLELRERLDHLEGRLAKVEAVSNACKKRLELHLRKTALLNQLTAPT